MIGQSYARAPLPDELKESRVGQRQARTGLTQLRDHLTPVGDEDLLAAPNKAEILAEAVFQLTNANGFHAPNVAA